MKKSEHLAFTNELGEEVSREQLDGYVVRVRKLSDKQIDQLWLKCGWRVHGREKKYDAVRQLDIDWIRESEARAKITVTNLLLESHIAEFEEHLAKIEKK